MAKVHIFIVNSQRIRHTRKYLKSVYSKITIIKSVPGTYKFLTLKKKPYLNEVYFICIHSEFVFAHVQFQNTMNDYLQSDL